MKMLNNGLEADVFATSRTPIQSPQSTKMGEGDLRYVARPPERPTQVHPDPHAEDGAVAVAPLGANANAPRLDDHHVDVGSRVGWRRSSWMSKKAFSC